MLQWCLRLSATLKVDQLTALDLVNSLRYPQIQELWSCCYVIAFFLVTQMDNRKDWTTIFAPNYHLPGVSEEQKRRLATRRRSRELSSLIQEGEAKDDENHTAELLIVPCSEKPMVFYVENGWTYHETEPWKNAVACSEHVLWFFRWPMQKKKQNRKRNSIGKICGRWQSPRAELRICWKNGRWEFCRSINLLQAQWWQRCGGLWNVQKRCFQLLDFFFCFFNTVCICTCSVMFLCTIEGSLI